MAVNDLKACCLPLFSAQVANADADVSGPIKRVLESYWYILGREVEAFEREFAQYIGTTHCVAVANGTDALELALRCLGIKSGDAVALVANAGFYGSTALHAIGAVCRYVDVNPTNLTMLPAQLDVELKSRECKAVIITHLFGQLADMAGIQEVASRHSVPVIEDCAQAHGASRGGQRAGTFGVLGCFSFYPTKNLGALGDGGAVVTQDERLAGRLKELRQYGWVSKYRVCVEGGRNSRLDEIQAAVLRAKLPLLDRWNEKRRVIARAYNEAFMDLPVLLPVSTAEDYVAHLYVLRLENRESFRQYLTELGVSTEVHYPIPDHLQTAYRSEQRVGALPVTEAACSQVVSLPCYPGLEESDLERIIRTVRGYFNRNVR